MNSNAFDRKNLTATLNTLAPFLALVAVFSLFALFAPPGFTSTRNIDTILRQTATVSIAALGVTIVILMGGIDLSVGSVVALTTVVIALGLNAGLPPLVAAAAGIAVAGACGILNGLMITKLKLMPFIATLATYMVARGIANGLAGEQKVTAAQTWLNELLRVLPPERQWLVLAPGVWLALILALIVMLALRKLKFGLHAKTIGSNEATAHLCGIAVDRMKIAIYCLGSIFAGIAGVMQFSRLTVGDPTVAEGMELEVITAVVIGGGSLNGGRGSVVGTIIGALLMTVIRNGCNMCNLQNWVQQCVAGVIIAVAVTLDQYRQRASRAS